MGQASSLVVGGRPRQLLFVLALTVIAGACRDELEPTLGVADGVVGVDLDVIGEVAAEDVQVVDVGPDIDDPDTAGDVGPRPPGTFGAACEEAEDCFDGWCLDTNQGGVCSRACTTTCPEDWTCRQNVAILPDVAFVCMPHSPTLCRPCDSNADCSVPHDASPHACISTGDAGAFCGGVCETDSDCPETAFCANATDITGAVSRQCRPRDGQCACSSSDIAAGFSTTCYAGSNAGRCAGRRQCEEGGLSDCDAPTPAPDFCNGVDDNCDGTKDEAFASVVCEVANEFGACPGVTSCDDGVEGCVGDEPVRESCNGGDDNCDGAIDEEGAQGCTNYYIDVDGDTFGVGDPKCLCAPQGQYRALVALDCDDALRSVYPDAPERCNRRDDDCNSVIDEDGAVGCSIYHRDGDRDGYGDPDVTACLCAPGGEFDTRSDTDCDDADLTVNPAALEVCNGHDDDCNGLVDEEGSGGCSLFFADADSDDYGDSADYRCLCGPGEIYAATLGGDCDELDPDVNPASPELCSGFDDNCNGLVDEPGAFGCADYLRDGDRDGFGLEGDSQCLCAAEEPFDAIAGGDCNDARGDASPSGVETCDGFDNDCDGTVDERDAEGCTVYYQDRDLDGRGRGDSSACLCAPRFPYLVATTDDCDDTNPNIFPAATEVCNGLDDNCNGSTDEDVQGQCTDFYRDRDHDGWGDSSESRCLCSPEGEFTTSRGGDCDDDRGDVYPFADEFCGGGDENCNGTVDEADALGCDTYFLDSDQDTFGDLNATRCLCAPEGLWTATTDGDCNDASFDVKPGATELCNGADDNCDGRVDERGASGCNVYLRDTDGDHYGLALDAQCLCAPSATYRATVGGDCDDLRGAINPGATEVCNGVDDDCNGVADDPNLDACVVYVRDVDGDTYGDGLAEQCLCAPVGVFTATRPGDCDDLLASVNPDASEKCNGRDDDCDTFVDEVGSIGCTSYLLDADQDGFGVTGNASCLCAAANPWTGLVGGDCNDDNEDVNQGQIEICNGFDDNCDNVTDPDGAGGCLVRYRDNDRDGFGVSEAQRCLCSPASPWDAAVAGDCDDTKDIYAPGKAERCNGADDNCDGFVDEAGAIGCTTYYLDADGDGAGVTGNSRCLCAAQGAWTARVGGDCDDSDGARRPGNTERCNGIDDNCDTVIDEAGATGCAQYWLDVDGDTYGLDNSQTCLCAPVGNRKAVRGGDCDDARADINLAASEKCDSVDNDCDAIIDESECGLPTTNWPTFMFDARRTGHPFTFQGPVATDTPLVWKRQITAGVPFESSPIVGEDGDVVVLLGDHLVKLRVADGVVLWDLTLPAAAFSRASPTARVGGTIVAPTGNGVALVSKDGVLIWHVNFGGAAADRVTGSPIVDQNGTIYVISNTHARALGPAGEILWETAIEGDPTKASDPAIGPDGRLYFSGATHVYGMTRAGTINWTWCPQRGNVCDPTLVPRVSVTINEVGRVLAPMGNVLYLLSDGLTEAILQSSVTFTNGSVAAPIGSSVAVFSTGYECCNPAEYPLVTVAGATGPRMLNSNLSTHFTMAVNKADTAHGGVAFDRDGDIFVGSNATTPTGKASFSARRRRGDGNRGQAYWTADVDGVSINGAPILATSGTKSLVVFGDSSGTIYCYGR